MSPSSRCKVLEKCKPCRCSQTQAGGLSEKLAKHRPAERVIERQIVELATRCERCECKKEAENAG
ncbi:hypothetical protein E4T80_09930 [Muribacter muris]|uniref:Uncharacterized protein n=1 Tax=Muribacter muris TaxID=67855 RepID=A0A4Y9JUM3_9PAST|nr:hypothetical protein [Muribacter muris]MBF0785777.1 hypothetical protein [Muribacter muris]MBF0828251.1 hypothetical protein [Muribacter muris]TFV08599.1 hypothetical protein E4T80_09930 [Muribacter muris]